MNVGDIVYYKKDWKGKRPWYLLDISENGLCTIVLMRDGKYTHIKTFGEKGKFQFDEEYLNASIVNLKIEEICKL